MRRQLSIIVSCTFLVCLTFLFLIHDSDQELSTLEIPIFFARSQILAPYQYNYNRPESIPTLPVSSDVSYTVSPEVCVYFLMQTVGCIEFGRCTRQGDDFSDYIEVFPTRAYDLGTLDAMRVLGKRGEEGIPLGYEGPLQTFRSQ
jgi:hypothetical protein